MRKTALFLLLLLPVLGWGLTLDEAVELAKANNKDLQKERETIEKVDAQYRDVRGGLLPQLTLGGSYTLERNELPDASVPSISKLSDLIDTSDDLGSPQGTNDSLFAGNDEIIAGYTDEIVDGIFPDKVQNTASLAAQLKLSQVVFMADLTNGLKVVKKVRSLTSKNYLLLEREVVYSTKDMFNQMLLLQEVVRIQQEALDIARQHAAQVNDMYEQGLASEYDKLRADLEVAKLEPDLIQAQNNLDVLSTRFRDYIGWNDGEMTLSGELTPPAQAPGTLDDCIGESLQNRIELDLSSINTQINEVKLANAKDAYLPKVVLSAEYDKYTSSSDTSIESDEFGDLYQVGIGFSIPLFTGLSNSAKISQARNDLRMSQITHSDLEEKIELQVRNAYLSLQHNRDRLNVQQQNVALAQRGLEIAEARYENHVGIQLEVLDAQLQLRAARLAYLNAAYDTIMSDLSLNKALGRNL